MEEQYKFKIGKKDNYSEGMYDPRKYSNNDKHSYTMNGGFKEVKLLMGVKIN